jgi:REP element-mobilizing transposase RayT
VLGGADNLGWHMARPLRFIPANSVVEVTCRTVQGRRLLRPSSEMNELLLGVLGRSLSLHPAVELHAFVFAWNHLHLLVSVPDAHVLASFMGHLNSNVARQAGRLHDWREKFWGRRYRSIVIADEESQVSRLRYILSHGAKERWVDRPADWPGASSFPGLVDGAALIGKWVDREREGRALRRKGPVQRSSYERLYPVRLDPLPCWRELSADERRARCSALVHEIEEQLGQAPDAPALGVRGVLGEHPHSHPKVLKRSPAPIVHASTQARRHSFVASYVAFQDGFYSAGHRLRAGEVWVEFPEGAFPPPMPFRQPPRTPLLL